MSLWPFRFIFRMADQTVRTACSKIVTEKHRGKNNLSICIGFISSAAKKSYHSTTNDLDCVEFRQPRLDECVTVLFDSFCYGDRLPLSLRPTLRFFLGWHQGSASVAFPIGPVDAAPMVVCSFYEYEREIMARAVFRADPVK